MTLYSYSMDALVDRLLQLRWYDILDIVVVTYILVWLYSWVKGTRAFRVLLGMAAVVVVYVLAQFWGLFLTVSALEWLGQALLIFVLIIFAPEIRQVLERLNPLRIWRRPEILGQYFVDDLIKGLEHLSSHLIGALIVIERQDPIRDLVRPGIRFGSEVQREILISIFQRHSPLHDGAAWIQDGRIHEVGVFLPISKADLPIKYGSRHRAAVGITEVSDALVIAVSEERGSISLAEDGRVGEYIDLEALAAEVRRGIQPAAQIPRPTWHSIILKEWKAKLITFFFVLGVWFVLAGQQSTDQIFSVPILYQDLPDGYVLISRPAEEASVRLSGPRHSLARLDPSSLEVRIDLSGVQPGMNIMTVDPTSIYTPPEVNVTQIQPQVLQIEVERAGS
ncbi:MAG: diadenylate cyclase [Acidobacteriota bacterium]